MLILATAKKLLNKLNAIGPDLQVPFFADSADIYGVLMDVTDSRTEVGGRELPVH
jgi:hypothetical protein